MLRPDADSRLTKEGSSTCRRLQCLVVYSYGAHSTHNGTGLFWSGVVEDVRLS